jgi:hypothetical protein
MSWLSTLVGRREGITSSFTGACTLYLGSTDICKDQEAAGLDWTAGSRHPRKKAKVLICNW